MSARFGNLAIALAPKIFKSHQRQSVYNIRDGEMLRIAIAISIPSIYWTDIQQQLPIPW